MKYDDIINLEHFHNPKRPFMSRHDRAAQFMPFKSLKAYEEAIDDKKKETFIIEERQIISDEFYFE